MEMTMELNERLNESARLYSAGTSLDYLCYYDEIADEMAKEIVKRAEKFSDSLKNKRFEKIARCIANMLYITGIEEEDFEENCKEIFKENFVNWLHIDEKYYNDIHSKVVDMFNRYKNATNEDNYIASRYIASMLTPDLEERTNIYDDNYLKKEFHYSFLYYYLEAEEFLGTELDKSACERQTTQFLNDWNVFSDTEELYSIED